MINNVYLNSAACLLQFFLLCGVPLASVISMIQFSHIIDTIIIYGKFFKCLTK